VLFGKVSIPAVYREVVENGSGRPGTKEIQQAAGAWLSVVTVTIASNVRDLQRRAGLHAGEAEAIVLAGEVRADAILLDDQRGVDAASATSLTVPRTPGLYLAAKRAGIIPRVKPKLESLRAARFRLREEHSRLILERPGES